MNGSRTSVTGEGALIGSHLVKALLRRGAEVRALVHHNAERSIGDLRFLPAPTLQRVEIVFGDPADPASLDGR
jgi:uncharacterized protein YbjT (DUF2867 family)